MSIKVISPAKLATRTQAHATTNHAEMVGSALHHLFMSGNYQMLNICKYWFDLLPNGKKASDYDNLIREMAMFIIKESKFLKDKETKAYLVQGQKPSIAYKSLKATYEGVAKSFDGEEEISLPVVWAAFKDKLVADGLLEQTQNTEETPKTYADKALGVVPKTQKAMDALSDADKVLAKAIYQLVTGKAWQPAK